MSHRDRNENRARKDPNQLAKRTKVHVPKPVYNRKTCKTQFVVDLRWMESDNETTS